MSDERKAREWEICKLSDGIKNNEWVQGEQTHRVKVIEASAYEKLKRENAEMRAELHKWVNTSIGKELACLRVERDRYFIALEEIEFKCLVTSEVGAIARKALEAP